MREKFFPLKMNCKNCQSRHIVKNGIVRNQQRYKCKECGYNFVEGDKRFKQSTKVKKALAIILYSLSRASFRFLAKLFNTNVSQTYRWIRREGDLFSEEEVSGEIQEIEIDEMWHYIQSKKTKNGSSKPWIVSEGELLPGWSVVVMLQPLKDSTKK